MRLLLKFITVLSLIAIAIIPLCFTLAQSEANPERTLPDRVHPGDTFNVTVNFTSPDDNFSAIVITDYAPQGWEVKVRGKWCDPKPKWVLSTNSDTDNKIEVYWNSGTYPQGEKFTVKYRVNVSLNASRGDYNFSGDLYSHYDPEHPQEAETETIGGDCCIYVPLPEISFIPGNISFTACRGGASPQDREFEIWNSGDELLNWALNCSASWLGVNSTGGNSSGEHDVIAVSANITGMPAGNYSATINITAPVANNSPQVVPVALHISLPGGDGDGGSGGITVLRGDVNEDGRVDRDDVVMVMKIILGVPGFEEFIPGADCNEDGKVNALDITAIKIIILELD